MSRNALEMDMPSQRCVLMIRLVVGDLNLIGFFVREDFVCQR